MTQTEMKYLIDSRKIAFEQLLSQSFEQIEINKEKCFCVPSGVVITITPLYSVGALVIEYADGLAEAETNTYEDGDLFFVEDYAETEMFHLMLQEINQ